MELAKFENSLKKVTFQDKTLNSLSLEEILDSIPRVDSLERISPGTPVLLRSDLDIPLKDNKIIDYSRIESCAKTIKYCNSKGFITILFGHIGRDERLSLVPVHKAFSEYLNLPISFVSEWLDEENDKLNDEFVELIKFSRPGTIIMLENTRKYKIERALWNVDAGNFPSVAKKMFNIISDIRSRLCKILINEAIAASNIDFSSSAVPLLMDKSYLGFFISEEFNTHIKNARKSNIVIFSGLKINKLDDLERIVDRGELKVLIAGGSLSMALLKAKKLIMGQIFSIGLAETDKNLKSYIKPERIVQAKNIIPKCNQQKIDLVLPIDFVLDNGVISDIIPPQNTQLDIGPKTNELIATKIESCIEKHKKEGEFFCAYFNGVFGKFEDKNFERGTKSFIPLLSEMTKNGIPTYVGGGEGRLALTRFGKLEDVTHAFTCGGTVLKSLTNYHIAFLKAMYCNNLDN